MKRLFILLAGLLEERVVWITTKALFGASPPDKMTQQEICCGRSLANSAARTVIAVLFLAASSLSAFATEAEDEQLLGLWKSDESCFVHIYQTDDDQLVGAAWGQRKESAELSLTVGDDRRFPWKRKSKKSAFGDDGELDPKRKGRFIVGLKDRNILHSNFSPCFIRKGAPSRWKRVDVSSIAVDKVPKWYQAKFQSSQILVSSDQPEVEDTESVASKEAKAKVKAKNQAQAKSAEPESETVATSVQTTTATTADSKDNAQTGPAEKVNTEDDGSGGLFKSLFGSKDSDNVNDQESHTGRSADEDSSSDSSSSTQQSSNLLGGLVTGLAQLDKAVQKAVEDVAGDSIEDQTPRDSTQGPSTENAAASSGSDTPAGPEPEFVTLNVKTNLIEMGKTLFIDGEIKEETTATEFSVQIAKGLHEIRVESKGFLSFEEVIEVQGPSVVEAHFLARLESNAGDCESERKICMPDESKTLFVDLAEKRGLIPDPELGCGGGCDECEADLDELVDKAGGRDQLKLLLSGSCVNCELAGLDLRDVDLSAVSQKLSRKVETDTVFFDVRGSNLEGADFSGMVCRTPDTFPVDLTGSTTCFHHRHDDALGGPCKKELERWMINLTDATFDGTDIRGSKLSGIRAIKAKFTNSDLRGARFQCSVMSDSVFHGSDLRGVSFNGRTDSSIYNEWRKTVKREGFGILGELSELDLSRTDFSGVDLEGSTFGLSTMIAVKFTDANLKGVIFDASDLTEADFSNADLRGAMFSGVDLTGAVFDGAKLDKNTTFKTVDLSNARLDKAIIVETNFTDTILCKTMTPWGQDDGGCG
jgi:uncharacterized protein YjbI with pentapeptide repeats